MWALVFIAPILFSVNSAALKQFSLKCDNRSGGNLVFSLLYFAISTIIALVFALIIGVNSVESMIFGLIYGVLFYGFVTLYSNSMKEGPLSYTAFIFSISMIIPIALSIILFKESVSIFQIIGLVLIIVALYLINFANQHSKKSVFTKKWIILCVVGAIFNGLLLFVSKYYSMSVENGNLGQFLFVGYLTCALLCIPRFAFPDVRETLATYKFNWWVIVLALIVGIVNVVGNGMVSFLGKTVGGAILFPVTNGFSVVMSIIISRFFFHEELRGRALAGMCVGVLAVVLLSL
ncbi:MAG: EamA family transporter [Clostridia bacterium]